MPPALRRKAEAEGGDCLLWLDELPDLIWALEQEWEVEVGPTLAGGTAAFVASGRRSDNTPVVVKLAMPAAIDGREALAREARVLGAAAGRGCVRALAYDEDRGALLLESLGAQLAESGLALHRQLDIILACLQQLWSAPADPHLPSEPDRASWVTSFVSTEWDQLDRPCPVRIIDRTLELARRRAAGFRPERAVLAHGDGHVWNALEARGGRGRYTLIDPDGLYAEPEYDLSISMREYIDDLVAGDPLDRGRRRAARLADRSGLDPERIWEWGFVELVTNGLLLIKSGKDPDMGRVVLFVAQTWMGS